MFDEVIVNSESYDDTDDMAIEGPKCYCDRMVCEYRAMCDCEEVKGVETTDVHRHISSYEKVNDRVANSSEFVRGRHRNSLLRLDSSNTILTTTIQMPPRIVPLEIWWLVIEKLRGDFNALYACTQVCRSWRKGSKRLLNDVFVEFSNRQDIALAGKRRGSSWKGPRHVTVVGDTKRMSIPHLGTFATMLARKWTRVEKLTIKNADWITGDIHADVFLHLAAWPSITCLMLRNVRFPTIATFGRLVLSFPNLEKLSCIDVSFAKFINTTALPLTTKGTNLSSLAIQPKSPSLSEITRFFTSCRAGTGLTHVDLGYEMLGCLPVKDMHSQGIQSLLHGAGATLDTINLSGTLNYEVAFYIDEHVRESALDLSRNLKLRRLLVQLRVDGEHIDYSWLSKVITSITSISLEFVFIELDIRSWSSPRQLDAVLELFIEHCSIIDHHLSLPTFANLRDFWFTLVVPKSLLGLYKPSWLDIATNGFPMLHDRGVLRIEGPSWLI